MNYKSLKVCTLKGLLYWQGSFERSPSVLIGSCLVGISPYRPIISCIFLVFESRPKCQIINYFLTYLARAVLSNIGPRSSFVRNLLHLVRTATTSGQYSPVRPSRSVCNRLILIFVVVFFQMWTACRFFSSCWNGIYDKNYDRNVKCAMHSSFVAVSHRNQQMIELT